MTTVNCLHIVDNYQFYYLILRLERSHQGDASLMWTKSSKINRSVNKIRFCSFTWVRSVQIIIRNSCHCEWISGNQRFTLGGKIWTECDVARFKCDWLPLRINVFWLALCQTDAWDKSLRLFSLMSYVSGHFFLNNFRFQLSVVFFVSVPLYILNISFW